MRRLGWTLLVLVGVASVVPLVALYSPLLLSDVRDGPVGDATLGRATLRRTRAAHGGLDAWLDRQWVELDLLGEVPFFPAQLAFGVGPDVRARIRYDPQVAGVATLALDGGDPVAIEGPHLLADSVRHLWEFPFAMASADVVGALAPRAEKQRTFASWGTQDPQLHTDQYIVWTGENGLVERFDSTGRAVAPFILARVVFEDHRDVEGFQLPGQVTVFEAGEAGSVVHAWRVVDVRLGPPRSR